MDEKLIENSCIAMQYAYYAVINPNKAELRRLNKECDLSVGFYQLFVFKKFHEITTPNFGGLEIVEGVKDSNGYRTVKISWEKYVDLLLKLEKNEREKQLMIAKLYGPNSEVAKEAESHFNKTANELESL